MVAEHGRERRYPGPAHLRWPRARPVCRLRRPRQGAGNDCFRYNFVPGGSIAIDITGTAVTMLGGSYSLNTFPTPTPLVFGTMNLSTNVTTTIYGATAYTPAAYGTLVGDGILWTTAANVAVAGVIQCDGPNCGLVSMPDGVSIPFEPIFSAISATSGVTALNLGEWQLNATHDAILASTNAITRWSGVEALGNRRSGVVTFKQARPRKPGSRTGRGSTRSARHRRSRRALAQGLIASASD